ncbi:hypothetical protein PSU4_00450 [Pseudonocardia sulfidoxydans NBRC 16205]|uniref:SHOCT domain-containing protein n=1 Tax=Pseudonocardia sulfidoxydans NBRC 16205 TaxID=1223511 RepID=A0A511D8G7_9PSEU|nr:SHOCT domain-containing protein [Pseudonocardia sulfidoxydans]GEL21091.1 hypothetical protein PSU4_00450 [Pseudonocardia sulfidoxydans NBRC 16205]
MIMRRRFGRPGLLGTMARTAVVAGTAQAVTGGMARHAAERDAERDAQAQAQETTYQSQAEIAHLRQQLDTVQAQQAAAPAGPAPGGGGDMVAELEKLASLKSAGVLSDDEFAADKARLLSS